ncbi:MAG TPA: hypothetical protein PLB74_02740 [Candidatus Paceibacterota bacterium]|nr:hypothetical protein [Candidatus Paceibacterota bacterium]
MEIIVRITFREIIKFKGKTIWQNVLRDYKFTFNDGDEIYVGTLFFSKKDANKYLETLKYKEFYEVVGVTIDKSKIDNRKKR